MAATEGLLYPQGPAAAYVSHAEIGCGREKQGLSIHLITHQSTHGDKQHKTKNLFAQSLHILLL